MEDVLQVMRECYQAMMLVQRRSQVGAWSYKYAKVVQDSLDDLAEELIGDHDGLKQGETASLTDASPTESSVSPASSAGMPRRRRSA